MNAGCCRQRLLECCSAAILALSYRTSSPQACWGESFRGVAVLLLTVSACHAVSQLVAKGTAHTPSGAAHTPLQPPRLELHEDAHGALRRDLRPSLGGQGQRRWRPLGRWSEFVDWRRPLGHRGNGGVFRPGARHGLGRRCRLFGDLCLRTGHWACRGWRHVLGHGIPRPIAWGRGRRRGEVGWRDWDSGKVDGLWAGRLQVCPDGFAWMSALLSHVLGQGCCPSSAIVIPGRFVLAPPGSGRRGVPATIRGIDLQAARVRGCRASAKRGHGDYAGALVGAWGGARTACWRPRRGHPGTRRLRRLSAPTGSGGSGP